mgnify:CR=1 FL=1
MTGASFVEVEVDTETGAVRVLKYVAAHDVGRAIPLPDRSLHRFDDRGSRITTAVSRDLKVV